MFSEIGNETSLIRFVDNIDYMFDDILNGFLLKPHYVSFQSTLHHNVINMFDIWKERGVSNSTIRKLWEIREKVSDDSQFFSILISEFEKDNRFKWGVIHLIGSLKFQVPMKCFTEIRHNQKLHPYSVGFFGKYGIQLTKQWGVK